MRYSRRELEGLPTPREFIINNLSEYVKLLSPDEFRDYIFRGEPTNYHSTISSGLRGSKKYPFIKMKNAFKKEIYHKLNQDERNNFLAFSQHHGIPTNLIDFTSAPLIALYFACQPFEGSEDHDKEHGFVYLIKDSLIDITEFISKNEDEHLLNLFIQNKNNLVYDFYQRFLGFERKDPERFYYYFKKLNDDWQYYFEDGQPLIPKKSDFPPYENGEYKEKIEYKEVKDNILKGYLEDFSFEELPVREYTLKLFNFLKTISEYKTPIWQLNCIPNFVYSPILTFERGINQKGLFIYQAYLSFIEPVYQAEILALQRVWPDYVIVIQNKDAILQELDFMGINEKFVFGDYDNIARYIKRKYI
jgi:hypothetical protein